MRERASDWAEVLFGIIPEADLIPAFQRAVKDHQSTFPVSAYEVKEAFKKVDSERRQEQAELQAKLIERAEKESPNFNVCAQCFGAGFRRTFERDVWGTEHWGVVYCNDCDYWERRRALRTKDGHYKI